MPNAPSHNAFVPALVYRASTRSGSGSNEDIARLMKTLALASGGENTRRNLLGNWSIWVKERNAHGNAPWLHTLANQDLVLAGVLEVLACRCLVFNIEPSTARGSLAAINHFYRMYAG